MQLNKEGLPQVIFKLMNKSAINNMYKGHLRFYTPYKWINDEKKNGIGRGDRYEGTFCINCSGDYESILKDKYKEDLIVNRHGERLYYQLHSVIRKPVMAFYSLEDCHFRQTEECYGLPVFETNIDGRYYRDFFNGKSIEEINELPEGEKPSLLIILGHYNIKEFITQTINALIDQYGIVKDDIWVRQVSYDYDRNDKDNFIVNEDHPKELFYKGVEYSHQCEARIIVNSKGIALDEREEAFLSVEIPPMSYACIVDGYYPEGYKFKIRATVKKSDSNYDGYDALLY